MESRRPSELEGLLPGCGGLFGLLCGELELLLVLLLQSVVRYFAAN